MARFDADFLSGPSPVGRFMEPSDELVASKAEFGSLRRKRWFGLDA